MAPKNKVIKINDHISDAENSSTNDFFSLSMVSANNAYLKKRCFFKRSSPLWVICLYESVTDIQKLSEQKTMDRLRYFVPYGVIESQIPLKLTYFEECDLVLIYIDIEHLMIICYTTRALYFRP